LRADEPPVVAPVCAADEHDAETQRNLRSRERMLDGHVALVGFMGAGKSSLGRLVAERLGRPFYDTDLCIQERCGCTVQELFAQGRVEEFRNVEAGVVHALLDGEPAVLSLGGGALVNETTRAALFERCFIIHLYVSWAEVRASLPMLSEERPLLQRPLADVHQLYLDRQATYRDAHVRIWTPRDDPERALEHVLYALRRAG
jgi:shikimate kinase